MSLNLNQITATNTDYNKYPFVKNPTNLLSSENVPFNVTIPWDIQISQFLNITPEELKANYKKDQNLRSEIGSVCNMIRDYSVRYLFTQNNAYSNIVQVKELCYGRGYTMVKGKSYPTGVCQKKLTTSEKKVKLVVQDNRSYDGQSGQCKVRKGGYVPNLNSAESRDGFLKNFMDRKAHKNYLSNLKMGGMKFTQIQTEERARQSNPDTNPKLNSSTATPSYNNSTVNGKGVSFNPTPKERFDNGQRPELFKSDAYGNSDSNYLNDNIKKSWAEVKAALKEEENFLSGVLGGSQQQYKGTVSNAMVQMKDVPEYFCSVICASMDIDETIENIMNIGSDNSELVTKSNTKVWSPIADESSMLNVNGKAAGTSPFDNSQSFKLYNGLHECDRTPVDVDTCVTKGKELSEWFMQRLLNPGVICDYDKGNCGMLFKY